MTTAVTIKSSKNTWRIIREAIAALDRGGDTYTEEIKGLESILTSVCPSTIHCAFCTETPEAGE